MSPSVTLSPTGGRLNHRTHSRITLGPPQAFNGNPETRRAQSVSSFVLRC